MLASAGRRVKRPVKVGKSPPAPLFKGGEIRFPDPLSQGGLGGQILQSCIDRVCFEVVD